jgi:mannose-1-phosphate guanylyltransferase/mannose-6-phosphate isomerase
LERRYRLFRAQSLIEAFEAYAPKTLEVVSKAVKCTTPDLGFVPLPKPPWSMLESNSIDSAIMEKAQNLVAVYYASKWSDIGGWDAVRTESNQDNSGNVTSKSTPAIECVYSLLHSEEGNQKLVGLGLDNIMAIEMRGSVLLAHKDRSKDVKMAVDILKRNEIAQAEIFQKIIDPWVG